MVRWNSGYFNSSDPNFWGKAGRLQITFSVPNVWDRCSLGLSFIGEFLDDQLAELEGHHRFIARRAGICQSQVLNPETSGRDGMEYRNIRPGRHFTDRQEKDQEQPLGRDGSLTEMGWSPGTSDRVDKLTGRDNGGVQEHQAG